MFERTELILQKQGIERLKKSNVIVFGVGGVGGYVCEMLVRTGVQNITIVDFDTVSESNLNRQIIALRSMIGKNKVDVMKERIFDINPDCKVNNINKKLLPENLMDFNLLNYDFVVDCIDSVTSKIALIDYCTKNNINIISSMGTGNKNGIPNFVVMDIFETKNDGLAKVLRRELRKLNIKKYNIVCTNQESTIKSRVIGSVVYYPASCACVLTSYVVQKLIEEK